MMTECPNGTGLQRKSVSYLLATLILLLVSARIAVMYSLDFHARRKARLDYEGLILTFPNYLPENDGARYFARRRGYY